jgi:signal peptidase II
MRTFLITAALTVALDQYSKFLIKATMKMYQAIIVIRDIFKIIYIENSGIAFGIFNGAHNPAARWILAAVILIAIIAITYYWAISGKTSFAFNMSCGLILGGAIGNFIDRVIIGRVTDFIEVGYKEYTWPVFNVADSAVSVGVCLFILYMLMEKKVENAPGTL